MFTVITGYYSDDFFMQNIKTVQMTRVSLGPNEITVVEMRIYVGVIQTFKNIIWSKMFYFVEEWNSS